MQRCETFLVPSMRIDSLILDEEGDDGEVAFERGFVESGLDSTRGERIKRESTLGSSLSSSRG